MDELKKGILIVVIGLSPVILFALTFSTEVWYDKNWSNDAQGQEDFSIHPPNPLLGDRYMLIVGDYFSSYQGYIEGTVTIYNKGTGETQNFNINIDATSSYQGWDSDHHVVFLPPGEYTILWDFTPFAVDMYIYSHGWLMIEHDEPREVNGLQTLITMVSGFLAVIIVISGIRIISRRH